jgi:tetratricopeptide (TPR) repeat protein
LAINPKYSSAWQMVPGVAASRFEVQRDLQRVQGGPGPQMDRLFNDFDKTFEKIPRNPSVRTYIVQYVEYLAQNGGNPNKILTFCYNQGYERFYKQLKEPQMALNLLEAGLKTQWDDERTYLALAEIYDSIGNAAKASVMRQKAAAAQSSVNPG